ncbi:MAG TPA: energy transducer TonB [Candidatus Binatia bacterium]|nr:energy transducer TonB [Candidatus Binatia bacterium]
MTPRLRHQKGPALRGSPLPVTATILSLLTHGLLAVAIVVLATRWSTRESKTYVVNLVPAVAAVGSPQGRPSLPPRAEELPPRTAQKASELPERERLRPAPAAPPEMPARAPSLPDRALPERTLPPRAPGAPRPSDKELPQVASAAPAPSPRVTPPSPIAADVPQAALGQRSGSPQGAGPLTVTASDFPFAWYIAIVQRKIAASWDPWAQPGHQPVAVFTIDRDGRVSGVAIDKTSGNSYYDQKAVRAINDAVPFPPLPAEWPKPVLRIKLGFAFSQDRG